MPQIGQGRSLFDDTPVNGQLEKGITSNWAFDENATLRALIEASLPWNINIQPEFPPKSQTNWSTFEIDHGQIENALIISSGAQNAEIAWDVIIPAGTWNISIIGKKDSFSGIISVQFDTVEKGTIDTYSADPVYNAISTITGITIPTTKKIELKLKMTGKNQTSNSYFGAIISIQLSRTA